MASMCYVTEEMLRKQAKLSDFIPVSRELSIEDIATIVEVYETVLRDISSDYIKTIVVNRQGFFLFVIDKDGKSAFDLYAFLNKNYASNTVINCMNVKYIFNRGLSRGIYPGYEIEEPVFTSNEEDESTGYMDEEELQNIVQGTNSTIRFVRMGIDIPISVSGLVIGRSPVGTDYVIQGNNRVSRQHCKLYKVGSEVYVHDCKSSNGTYINGLRVSADNDKVLKPGDVLMLANEEFTLLD